MGGREPAPRSGRCAAALHVRVMEMRAQSPFAFSGTTIEILSPSADYAAATPGNNDSLAFRIVYGARSFLLTGDMERPMEFRILNGERPIRSDVLKVGHHGSKTSTTEAFLDAVSPSVAIISAGYENSFGHPHQDIVSRLNAHHSNLLRTDRDGLVTVRTDGHRLWFSTSLSEGGSAWWTGEHSWHGGGDWAFNWALSEN